MPALRSLQGGGLSRLGLRLGACLVLAATAAASCAPGEEDPPVPPAPGPSAEAAEFRDKMDLLRSIDRGTFAERAGVDLALEAPPPLTIPFVRGTEVPEDELPALRELAGRLKAERRLAVDLEGCSDPPGSAAVNRRISRARAESVAAALREFGAAESQIRDIVGRGEDCDDPVRAVHVEPLVEEAAERRSSD